MEPGNKKEEKQSLLKKNRNEGNFSKQQIYTVAGVKIVSLRNLSYPK